VTGSAAVWWQAARPRTLPAAAAPVVMGTAMAWREGAMHLPAASAAMAGALLLQIGTNYANDYYDHVKGADTDARIGPTRATAAGLVTPAAMKRAFVWVFAVAFVLGMGLVWRAGWPLLVIGVTSVACGVLYTGGPRPLGYLGLGDVLVLAFFGPVALAGTYYVQALRWSDAAVIAGLGPGLIATALLAVNNLRDAETDAEAGKRTLAVRFGRRFAKVEYTGALLTAAAVPVALWWGFGGPAWCLLATAACLTAAPSITAVIRAEPGDRLGGALAGTGRLLALYGLLFAAGWTVG